MITSIMDPVPWMALDGWISNGVVVDGGFHTSPGRLVYESCCGCFTSASPSKNHGVFAGNVRIKG